MLIALGWYFGPALAHRLRRGYAFEHERDISANSAPLPLIFKARNRVGRPSTHCVPNLLMLCSHRHLRHSCAL
ncbi:hypothetical protein C8R44DRAFT_815433, partial [Mycena epipterygia]